MFKGIRDTFTGKADALKNKAAVGLGLFLLPLSSAFTAANAGTQEQAQPVVAQSQNSEYEISKTNYEAIEDSIDNSVISLFVNLGKEGYTPEKIEQVFQYALTEAYKKYAKQDASVALPIAFHIVDGGNENTEVKVYISGMSMASLDGDASMEVREFFAYAPHIVEEFSKEHVRPAIAFNH